MAVAMPLSLSAPVIPVRRMPVSLDDTSARAEKVMSRAPSTLPIWA